MNLKLTWVVLVVCAFSVQAQQTRAPLNRDIYQAYEEHLNDRNVNFHTALKPYLRSDLYKESVVLDTVLPPHQWYWMRAFDRTRKELKGWELDLRGGPILDLSIGADIEDPNNDALKYIAGGGLYLEADLGPMLSAHISGRTYTAVVPSYVDSFVNVWEVMPGMGFADGNSPYNFNDWNGFVSLKPHKWFTLQAGRGKNFIGDGYRSLFLSDNAYSYPFFKLETQVWNIKYMIMYTNLSDVRFGPGDASLHRDKHSTFHYLSWNVSKRLNFSFFESIVWQSSDSLHNRGFDINYVNPVIFFRPVEFSQGSADNALMGFAMRVKIANKSQFYGQLLLDEFLMSEVRAGNGWFGNKQAFQLGFKTFSPFKLRGLAFQTEFNYVRPFTYTHGSVTQNYAHWNQPLAHPLGSNFYESVNIIDYRFKRFHIQEQFNYAFTGSDTSGFSFGNNIFRPESDRPDDSEGRNINYGYYVGKESPEQLFYNKIRVGYILDPNSGLRIEVGHLYRLRTGEGFRDATNMFFIGIRTTLFQQYQDF